jgi:hypothetical protein
VSCSCVAIEWAFAKVSIVIIYGEQEFLLFVVTLLGEALTHVDAAEKNLPQPANSFICSLELPGCVLEPPTVSSSLSGRAVKNCYQVVGILSCSICGTSQGILFHRIRAAKSSNIDE